MKSILYVGATLMIGASVYGFVDYKQTSQKKQFTTMYEEKKAIPIVADEPAIKPAVLKEIVAPEEKVGTKKEAVTVKTKKTSKDSGIVKKAKKKKKLDHRIFSRAPLRDEELELPEPVKVETKKLEDKER